MFVLRPSATTNLGAQPRTQHAHPPATGTACATRPAARPSISSSRCASPQATDAPTAQPAQAAAQPAAVVDPLQALTALASSQAAAAGASDASIAAVTRQVLMEDPETAAQLKRYEAALARVEAAKAAAAELEDIFAQAGKDLAAREAAQEAATRSKAKAVMADAEVAAAEKLLAAAQLEAARAAQAQARWAQEANQDVDRMESVKAGLAATVGGLLSAVPLLLAAQGEGSALAATGLGEPSGLSNVLSLATTAGSCFLFGVTYRYVVRWDSENRHLRSGAVGAFGLVRAAAAGDILQSRSLTGPLDVQQVIGPAALYTGESMILFAFAAAAVELAFRQGLVSRFGPAPGAAVTSQATSNGSTTQ